MNLVIDILGWAGAFLLIGTYFLMTLGKIVNTQKSYHYLNIAAGLLLGVSSLYYHALFSVALNTFWVLIASSALLKVEFSNWRKR